MGIVEHKPINGVGLITPHGTPEEWTEEELREHLESMWENRERPVTEVHDDGTMTITHGDRKLHITIPPEYDEIMEMRTMWWKTVLLKCEKDCHIDPNDIIAVVSNPELQYLVKKRQGGVPDGEHWVYECYLKPFGHNTEAEHHGIYIKVGSMLNEESHEYGTIKFE